MSDQQVYEIARLIVLALFTIWSIRIFVCLGSGAWKRSPIFSSRYSPIFNTRHESQLDGTDAFGYVIFNLVLLIGIPALAFGAILCVNVLISSLSRITGMPVPLIAILLVGIPTTSFFSGRLWYGVKKGDSK